MVSTSRIFRTCLCCMFICRNHQYIGILSSLSKNLGSTLGSSFYGKCVSGQIGAMRDVSATETAIIYGLEPLWGAGFAWFLLGERWGTTGWIGAALLLGNVSCLWHKPPFLCPKSILKIIRHCLIAGGSLTVQMFGSSSSSESIGVEDGDKEVDILVSEKQKLQTGLSASPVVIISSRKDVIDMLKKWSRSPIFL